MTDHSRPTEGVDHAQASRVAHTLNLGADGLPPRDLQTLARAYLDAIPREAVAWQVVHTRTGYRWSPKVSRVEVESQQRDLASVGITETRIAELVDATPLADAIPRATVREAVARVRDWPREFSGSAFDSGFNAALDALCAALGLTPEGK